MSQLNSTGLVLRHHKPSVYVTQVTNLPEVLTFHSEGRGSNFAQGTDYTERSLTFAKDTLVTALLYDRNMLEIVKIKAKVKNVPVTQIKGMCVE